MSLFAPLLRFVTRFVDFIQYDIVHPFFFLQICSIVLWSAAECYFLLIELNQWFLPLKMYIEWV